MNNLNCLKCMKKIDVEKSKYGLHSHCFQDLFLAEKECEFENIARKDGLVGNHDRHGRNLGLKIFTNGSM